MSKKDFEELTKATALPHNPDLECSMCFKGYKTPKILSCGHSFCLECLVRYVDGKKGKFTCPVCKQSVKIPRGGVDKFTTNVSLQTLTGSTFLKQYCPNHSQKEVEYYCQTCNLGLCSKCIFKDHNDHKILDLESASTREKVVEELSKSKQFINNKIEDLKTTIIGLFETSDKLKYFCDEACAKIGEKTETVICELKDNCVKSQQKNRDYFDKNESQLTETRKKVINQAHNIKTDLDTSCPTTTEEPTLTLINSLNKLQNLQKLCETMKIDIPPVTYVEWKEGSVKVCDIMGSTVTKPLYQSRVTKPVYQYRESSGPISTVTKPPTQPRGGNGPISSVTKPPTQPREGNGPISTVTKPPTQPRGGNGPISTVTKPPTQPREGNEPISTVTKPPTQPREGNGPISTVTKPPTQPREGNGPISTVTKPPTQPRGGNGPISTVTKPPTQSREGNGPISTVTKPPTQSREDSGPISTVTKPPTQSREGSGPISTVTKPPTQPREDNEPISTVTKPPTQSSFESSGSISTETKPLEQSSEGRGLLAAVTQPAYQLPEGSGPISTVTKPVHQSSESSGPLPTETKPIEQSNEGSGSISTVTKQPTQSSESSRPISSGLLATVTKPAYQLPGGSGPIPTVTKPLYESSEGSVFKFNYTAIKRGNEKYFSETKCTSHDMVWSCAIVKRSFGSLYIYIELLAEDNPQVKYCEIEHTLTILNKNKVKNEISGTMTKRFTVDVGNWVKLPWNELKDPSEGFIDYEDQLLVRFDILQVLETINIYK